MKASQTLIDALKQFEGYSPRACKADPSEKYYTYGYGHYGPDVPKDGACTPEMAEQLLKKDLKTAEDFVNRLGVAKTQGQFDALVDFAYNCGPANLSRSTLLRRIKAGMAEDSIREQFLVWNKCGGKVLGGLTKRRKWEADRFFS